MGSCRCASSPGGCGKFQDRTRLLKTGKQTEQSSRLFIVNNCWICDRCYFYTRKFKNRSEHFLILPLFAPV